jgi:hypothetical protein
LYRGVVGVARDDFDGHLYKARHLIEIFFAKLPFDGWRPKRALARSRIVALSGAAAEYLAEAV